MLKRLAATAASAILLFGAASAGAQAPSGDYPAQPLRFYAGFPPGGSTDILARIVTPALSQRLGQTVVVDNKAGAGGVIGVDSVAKSAPDGYSLGFGVSGALTTNVTLMKLPYDPLKDLALVSRVIYNPMVLAVNASWGVRSLKDFIAYAKAHPGEVNFGTAGPGTAMHLAGELLNQTVGIRMVHVPHKGSAAAAQSLLGNQIQAAVLDLASARGHLESKRLLALGVTSPRRTAAAPDLPTLAEAGVPGYGLNSWIAIVMPAATPPAILERMRKEVVAVLNDPGVREKILAAGMEPAPSTPEELRRTIETEIEITRKLVKAAGLSVN